MTEKKKAPNPWSSGIGHPPRSDSIRGLVNEEVDVSDDVLTPWEGESGPRFCGRCDREVAVSAATLCEECGERVIDQGYCPICERFWRLPAGDVCPKHEISLEHDRPRVEFQPAGGQAMRWVTVETFGDALKAEAPRIRLEAEGIPTFVEGARMSSHSMYPVATGGARLQVPQPLAAEARVILSQTWAPVTPADDLDDAWEELTPEPGAVRRSVMKSVILVILFGPFVVTLAAKLLGL
jgi:hypothetical protein